MRKKPSFVDQRVRYALICSALPPPPAYVYEVGVGGGWLLHYLREEGYDVRGCDISLKDVPPNSPIADRIQQTSGVQLPFPDNHFDATYSCDVLEHVYPAERTAFLEELIRVTKPGGVVALTAFFNNTGAFRLWGVGYLLFRGTLPSWYIEHLSIPLPSEEETFAHLKHSLTGLRRVRYQRFLNLFIMWLQSVGPRQRHLARLLEISCFMVPSCDVIGRTTSIFFTGVKAK